MLEKNVDVRGRGLRFKYNCVLIAKFDQSFLQGRGIWLAEPESVTETWTKTMGTMRDREHPPSSEQDGRDSVTLYPFEFPGLKFIR